MGQSKPSLWVLSFAVLGWIAIRAAVNLPIWAQNQSGEMVERSASPRLVTSFESAQKPVPHARFTRISSPRRTTPRSSDTLEQAANYGHAPSQNAIELPESGIFLRPPAPQIAGLFDEVTSFTALPKSPKFARDLSASVWLLLRSRVHSPTIAAGGQLGGSQAGTKANLRLNTLNKTTNVNGYARISTALSPLQQGEAAIGFSIRHAGKIASELQVERRIRITSGGRNDFALIGSLSLYGLQLAPQTTADAYLQAGIVGVNERDLFVDLAARIDRKLLTTKHIELSGGAGLWAAAQPDARRFDIGPQITIRPLGVSSGLRISGEWRFRVVGNADPSTGPTLTLGFDF